MTPNSRGKRDPIERDIEVALYPGAFIPDRAYSSFVTDLQRVATKIAKVSGTEPTRAVGLYETFVRDTEDAALEGVSHYVTEPATRRLEKRYPGAAARLWCALGQTDHRARSAARVRDGASDEVGLRIGELSLGDEFDACCRGATSTTDRSCAACAASACAAGVSVGSRRPDACSTGCSGSTRPTIRACVV